jgi:tRNA 2-thiouridine synthesizing protein A
MADSDLKHDFYLDVSEELCPMTFVRIRVLLDAMTPGQVAIIILSPGEALQNVPSSLLEQGIAIDEFTPVIPGDAAGKHRLTIVKPRP